MKILLIEDDLALGRALQSVLVSDGQSVVWLRMATDAIATLAQGKFDVLVLDLGLPDGDGMTLLRALRARGQAIPVIVITARDSLEDRLDGFDGGADDYLIKPFDIPELLARLRAVVGRARNGSGMGSAVWQCRDLVLDEKRMRLTRGGTPLAVSKTEFALLQVLMRDANRVVTRAELEAQVLANTLGTALDVHISNLRKKVGDGYIRTVRGVGYMATGDGA